ncbi:MAG: HAMP domain-containing histidine kinase [Phycisphaerae bacterium]|nr:HAMP domain-containing histidine kinase [Phycisphaerae bacterium]
MTTVTTVDQPHLDDPESQIAHLRAQVDALRHELHRAQRLAAVGTMTAMVAHEFNNILTPIINYAQLAKNNPKMVHKAIARAAEGGLRATEICKAILGITRDEDRGPSEEGLLDMTHEIIAAMAREPGKDGIELSIDIDEELTVTTRRLELQQVLMNLLINARTAVLAKPTPRLIHVTADRNDNWIFMRIDDNGVGIPPEIIDKIFKPFFTTKGVADGNDKTRGHGLGLALCREIMDTLSGDISVESTVGVGTQFALRFPVCPL